MALSGTLSEMGHPRYPGPRRDWDTTGLGHPPNPSAKPAPTPTYDRALHLQSSTRSATTPRAAPCHTAPMTRARKELIDLGTTPYYHCISRCVRRAFLCGRDNVTQKSFEHRKHWLVNRFAELVDIFAIELCAYAVMSNHYHVVLRVDPDRAREWTDEDVAARWARLYGNALAKKLTRRDALTNDEKTVLRAAIPLWRTRLHDISWFMRCINEPLARTANLEDQCQGRFWEGRFKSQALADEAALITCMTYVDLNPIRAGLTSTLQGSTFTSVKQRIEDYRAKTATPQARTNSKSTARQTMPALAAFANKGDVEDACDTLPIDFASYLSLVDWTGRAIRHDKKGAIPSDVAPILTQLGINPQHWTNGVQRFNREFHSVAGTIASMQAWCERLGQKWLKGFSLSRLLFAHA